MKSSGPTRCTATTARGQPCKRWACRGSDPPRCAVHGGARGQGRAPNGNGYGTTHGAYAQPEGPPEGINGQIEDLDRRIAALGDYIDAHQSELDPGDLIRLLNLHSTMIGRASRVRAIRQRIAGGDDADRTRAIHEAMDKISEKWGIQL